MNDQTYVKMTLVSKNDIFYNLDQAAMGLRTMMNAANHEGDYGREAELGDMLTHVLLSLANLPPKTDDFPF